MNLLHPRRSWLTFAILALILSLFAAWAPVAIAQESLIPDGAPVDIHTGTCDDFLTEPAYDAGDITPTITDDVWDDERFQTGILVDEAAGISGVDRNGDNTLQPDEVIVLNLESAELGVAEGDLGEAIDTSEPSVVVVHAGPDQYETILACGGPVGNAEEVEGGRQLLTLEPVGDSQLFGYSVLEEDGQSMVTYLFQPNPEAAASATPVDTATTEPAGFPVDIHSGTCGDWTTEPTFDLGDMQLTNVAAEGEQAPGDMEGEVPQGAESLGDIYKVQAEGEFSGNELLDEGSWVVAVHESADNYTELIACGQVLPVYDGDDLLVILQPVGTGEQTGFVRLSSDGGEANGLLWNCTPIEPAAPEATPTPMPTLEPTPEPTEPPTEPATAVVEATEVVVETEVVEAPTATAMAEEGSTPAAQGQEGSATDLGDGSSGTLTTQAGQVIMLGNPAEAERTFVVQDLGIEQVIAAGDQIEVQIPDDAEPGSYPYQILEGEETIFEGDLTIE
jgi:hypothetical protein